jgi:hypothetical protein
MGLFSALYKATTAEGIQHHWEAGELHDTDGFE